MNIAVEKLPNCKASVRVQVPKEKHTTAREEIIRGYVKHAALPGFRKGKVPRSVVEKRFKEEIEREVTEKMLNESVSAAARQEKLQILQVTGFKPAPDAAEGEMTFLVELELAPEVNLPDYKGLKIKVPALAVTDAEVEKVIDRQREQLATLKDAADGHEARMGDFATIDYSASIDGKPLKDVVSEAESYIAENNAFLLKLGEDSFLPGFCAQLVGLKKGDKVDAKVTMPEEGISDEAAGKEVIYTTTIVDLKEAELPAADDALAERMVPGKTLDELRGMIRQNLEYQTAQKDMENKRLAAMAALREKASFDIPESVIHNATQQRVNQLVKMNVDRGVPQDILVENESDIINAASEQAKVDVKDEFLLVEVARAENVQVTNEDLSRRIVAIAQNAKTSPQKVLKTLQKDDSAGLKNVQHSLVLAKALDALVQYAEIETTTESETAPAAGDAPAA